MTHIFTLSLSSCVPLTVPLCLPLNVLFHMGTNWLVLGWQQVKTETQHACTQIKWTNMRCRVSKRHWHMSRKQIWSIVTLSHVTFQDQGVKGSSFKHRCHFLLCILHLWASSRRSTQSHLWGGFNHAPSLSKNAQSVLSYVFPSQSSRKSRESCQRRGSFPTSGLELWLSRGGSTEESWSYTRPDRYIALERQKRQKCPKGIWWHS